MTRKPPLQIEDMQSLYYADVRPYKTQLQTKMPKAPDFLVIVFWPVDKSYCILGTDAIFEHWDDYTNYAFKEIDPALQFTDTMLRLPDDFRWLKV